MDVLLLPFPNFIDSLTSGSALCEHTNSHIANKMAMLVGQITNKLQK